MTPASFLAYSAAVSVAVAAPGPAMFAVISTGISRGFVAGFLVGVGVGIADAVLVALALAGLVALVQAFDWLFVVLKFAGAAYLIWLGVKMWRAPLARAPSPRDMREGRLRRILLGMSIGLGNPKAILFHASIMPLILDLNALTWVDGVIMMGVVISANSIIMGVYAALSGTASHWFRSERAMRVMNRFAGAALIGTGALIATR